MVDYTLRACMYGVIVCIYFNSALQLHMPSSTVSLCSSYNACDRAILQELSW